MARSPFHEGEQAVQARVGLRDRMESIGRRTIGDHMPEEHREFFAELPFVVLGAQDASLRPWAAVLAGPPGFARSPDPLTLRVDAPPGPPIALAAGAPVGLLGIQLDTRRRNRANGVVRALDARGFEVLVTQSFGNCPQYIQARSYEWASKGAPVPGRLEGAALSAEARALVERADTFFIATAARASARLEEPSEGVDVSHRGGKPGFVLAQEDEGGTRLTWPDFRGNFYFNTLGNLAQNPRAGLVFPDFESGDALQLTGTAETVWDGPELAAFARAERLVRFRVAEGRWVERAWPLRWSAPSMARELPATGEWRRSGR